MYKLRYINIFASVYNETLYIINYLFDSLSIGILSSNLMLLSHGNICTIHPSKNPLLSIGWVYFP